MWLRGFLCPASWAPLLQLLSQGDRDTERERGKEGEEENETDFIVCRAAHTPPGRSSLTMGLPPAHLLLGQVAVSAHPVPRTPGRPALDGPDSGPLLLSFLACAAPVSLGGSSQDPSWFSVGALHTRPSVLPAGLLSGRDGVGTLRACVFTPARWLCHGKYGCGKIT